MELRRKWSSDPDSHYRKSVEQRKEHVWLLKCRAGRVVYGGIYLWGQYIEAEAEDLLWLQDETGLHHEFQARLGYKVRSCLVLVRVSISMKRFHDHNNFYNLGGLQFQRLSPLSSRQETWWHAGRHGAGEGADPQATGNELRHWT